MWRYLSAVGSRFLRGFLAEYRCRRRRRRRCRVDVAAPLLTRRCDLYSVTARLDAPPCQRSVPRRRFLVRQRRPAATGYERRNYNRAIRSSGLERTPVHTANFSPDSRIDSSNSAQEAPSDDKQALAFAGNFILLCEIEIFLTCLRERWMEASCKFITFKLHFDYILTLCASKILARYRRYLTLQ